MSEERPAGHTLPYETRIERVRAAYLSWSIILANTILGFVALNLLLLPIIGMRNVMRSGPDPTAEEQVARVASLYPNASPDSVQALLRETWTRDVQYAPFTQFRESPHSGQYVNVSRTGFRTADGSEPWPPQNNMVNVFVFGGSTTFGYGVSDWETIPARLGGLLEREVGSMPIRVYNFGQGFYYSTQERILFEQLLSAGVTPDLAVFIDGLNDLYYADDAPEYSSVLAAEMARRDARFSRMVESLSYWLPAGRAGLFLLERLGLRPLGASTGAPPAPSDPDAPRVADRLIDRYLANVRLARAAAAEYGSRTLFVWQPVPTYAYDTSQDPFASNGYGRNAFSGVAYARMAERLQEEGSPDDFLWLADLQRDLHEPLYVDRVHYGPRFSDRIAAAIAGAIVDRRLLVGEGA